MFEQHNNVDLPPLCLLICSARELGDFPGECVSLL
jgi:hypothetical protein